MANCGPSASTRVWHADLCTLVYISVSSATQAKSIPLTFRPPTLRHRRSANCLASERACSVGARDFWRYTKSLVGITTVLLNYITVCGCGQIWLGERTGPESFDSPIRIYTLENKGFEYQPASTCSCDKLWYWRPRHCRYTKRPERVAGRSLTSG